MENKGLVTVFDGLYKTIDESNDLVKKYLEKFPEANLTNAVSFVTESLQDNYVTPSSITEIEQNFKVAEEKTLEKLA